MQKYLMALLVLVCLHQSTMAAPILTTVDPTKADSTFIAGTGIPGGMTFWGDVSPNGQGVYLRARDRDTGLPNSIVGNTFFVDPGLNATNTAPNLSIDYQFSPGTMGLPADQYLLTLMVDFDPSFGTSFVTISMLVGGPSPSWQADSDGFFLNPGPGLWSDDNVPYVVSNSFHLGFGFWQLLPGSQPYDPFQPANYEIRLGVSTPNGDPIAQSTIFAQVGDPQQVVPEPASIALFGSILLMGGAAAAWRRRKTAAA